MMKLTLSTVSLVNGHDAILIDGVYNVYRFDERDGLIPMGPDFDEFKQAAEYAPALPDASDQEE